MKPFGIQSLLLGSTIATYLAKNGLKRKSLSISGAITAWIVGFLSIACGLRGFLLLIFYKLGSSATKYKKSVKERIDGDASKSSVRGPYQVLACSAISVACSVYHALYFGEERAINFDESPTTSSIACTIIAHHAVCLGDTFASELGILSKSKPFLITAPWRNVPPGTNGGISIEGTIWSAVGGALIGLSTILIDMTSGLEVKAKPTIFYGILCGLLGSALDSLIGATLQASYYDYDKRLTSCHKVESNQSIKDTGFDLLTNAQVNLVSIIPIIVAGGLYIAPFLFR